MKKVSQHNKCIFIKSNGSRCNSFAIKNSSFCYVHDENIPEDEKREMRRKGGKSKVLVITKPEIYQNEAGIIPLSTPFQVTKFYGKIINAIMNGEMDLRLGTGLTFILNGLLKSMEISSIEQRINEIEISQNKLNQMR